MIQFKPVQHKNPITKEVKWYPQVVAGHPLLLDEVAERISLSSTVTEHDVKAVLSALQEQVIFALREGRSVRLGDLGSFRVTLAGTGAATADEVTVSSVSGLRVRFSRSSRLRTTIRLGGQGIRFTKVTAAATEDEAPLEPEE